MNFSTWSSKKITIDSVTLTNTSLFSLNKNFAGQVIDLFTSDSIKVSFRSDIRGRFYDTVKIFHNAAGITNPLKIAVTGTANTPPYLNKSIPVQTTTVFQLFTFQIPDSTFLDNDIGDSLTYQASGLPTWLSFDAPTRTFQGTPTQTGQWVIAVQVKDIFLSSVSTTFQLSVVQQTMNTTYTMGVGWNLVSVSTLQSNYSASVLFPQKIGSMFRYDALTEYSEALFLENGPGYWVNYDDSGHLCYQWLYHRSSHVYNLQSGVGSCGIPFNAATSVFPPIE